jgi:hypothetical protein
MSRCLSPDTPDFTDQTVTRLTTDGTAPTTSNATKKIRAGQRRPGGTAP